MNYDVCGVCVCMCVWVVGGSQVTEVGILMTTQPIVDSLSLQLYAKATFHYIWNQNLLPSFFEIGAKH